MTLKPKILVADEEPTVLDSVGYVLEQDGFLISSAWNGSEKREVCRR